ncbi:hypothetical protein [Pedobacter sp. NJ-S-72]
MASVQKNAPAASVDDQTI